VGNTLTLGSSLTITDTTAIAPGVVVNVVGNTTISSGIFSVNGTLGGDGAKIVGSSATLKGNGTIAGPTTIQAGATLAPGNSPGLLTFTGNLTLAGTTTIEVKGAGTDRGVDNANGYDAIDVTGLLTYGGTLTMSFDNTPVAGTTYDIFGIYGTQAGDFGAVTFGGTYSIAEPLTNTLGIWSGDDLVNNLHYVFTQSSGDLVVTAIPEPATYAALAGLGMIGFVLYRRRRQQVAKRAA
jgi:hypothetical protein